MYWNILNEAAKIAEQRQEEYGNYWDSFKTFEMIGGGKYKGIKRGVESLTVVKMGRLLNDMKRGKRLKKDTALDLINYLAMLVDWDDRNPE